MAMATAMRTRTLPKTSSITPTQSMTLVKNMFRASFSSIAYIRDLFEDDCFIEGSVGGTKYHKIVVSDTGNPDARMFVSWLEQGVFDALSKGYLDTVLLEIYANIGASNRAHMATENVLDFQGTQNADSGSLRENTASRGGNGSKTLVEVFSFSVSYPRNSEPYFNVSRSARAEQGAGIGLSKENIKKNTSEVLRMLVQMSSTLQPLPELKTVSIKLLYTPKTPVGYEPPLFQAASAASMSQWFENRPLRISPGKVLTPYHEMSINIRTALNVRSKPLNEDMESETTTDSTMSSVGESEITRPPQRVMHPREGRNVATKSSSEHVDIGASYGNSCRGVRKTQYGSSKFPKGEVDTVCKPTVLEKRVAEAANEVRKLSIKTNSVVAKQDNSANAVDSGFNGRNVDTAPKRASMEPKTSLHLRVRKEPRASPISGGTTPQTNEMPVDWKQSEAKYRSSTLGARTSSENPDKRPTVWDSDLDQQMTARDAPTIGASAKRRKVSEVANPIEPRSKRMRRSVRTRELANGTGGTENVSTCF